jgi:hypothetical protein
VIVTLELWGGPCDGDIRSAELYPSGAPALPVTGYQAAKMRVDTRGRPNPTRWVSRWDYPAGGVQRRGWCRAQCTHDACPNNRRATPPPAGGTT